MRELTVNPNRTLRNRLHKTTNSRATSTDSTSRNESDLHVFENDFRWGLRAIRVKNRVSWALIKRPTTDLSLLNKYTTTNHKYFALVLKMVQPNRKR